MQLRFRTSEILNQILTNLYETISKYTPWAYTNIFLHISIYNVVMLETISPFSIHFPKRRIFSIRLYFLFITSKFGRLWTDLKNFQRMLPIRFHINLVRTWLRVQAIPVEFGFCNFVTLKIWKVGCKITSMQ